MLGIISVFFVKTTESTNTLGAKNPAESYKEIIIRAAKIYLFVMGLTFLGHGFEPLIDRIYPWLKSSSIVLDQYDLSCPG